MKWRELPATGYQARAWRGIFETRDGSGDTRRYTISEISDRHGDLYVLEVSPSEYGHEVFVDRDGNETATRTSRSEFRSKAEAVRAARKHVQKHTRRRS